MSHSYQRGRVLLATVVLVLLALIGALEYRRRAAQGQLEDLSVKLEQLQTGNTRQNKEAALRIVERVGKLIRIPEGEDPTVATIVDVETLRERNPFYENAENGDHLVVTSERAILYDPDEDRIVDVVPVQIQPTVPEAGGPVVEGEVEEDA